MLRRRPSLWCCSTVLTKDCKAMQAVSNQPVFVFFFFLWDQPVLASMKGDGEQFVKSYKGGIYYDNTDGCTNDHVPNHAVLIVGFDVGSCPEKSDGSGDPDVKSGQCTGGTWIVRNSWGSNCGNWGECAVMSVVCKCLTFVHMQLW